MELTLDRIELWLLGAAFGVSFIPLMRANGSRPFVLAMLIMGALWAWTAWDGFGSTQSHSEHARRLIAGATLAFVLPWIHLRQWRRRGD